MNRIEFLKRLGLGAVAAVAAPALIKSNPEIVEPLKDECIADFGKPEKLIFWRAPHSNEMSISSSCVTFLDDFKRHNLL